MAWENNCSGNNDIIPLFNVPPKLCNVAAIAVIRLLVYEDYEDCNFYRWDPVIIWQFETHQPKKKKSAKKNVVDNSVYGHPPPPWKGIKKLRDWWFEKSIDLLGHPVESPLRQLVIDALEKQSWTSHSEEESILFLLLRLCMDSQLHFSTKCINENWYSDLAQIIENLGPFPLQKLIIGNDVFQGNTIILSTIIQYSPNLQVLRIGQWELSNDILFCLSNHCPLLQEFTIHGMEQDVFMSDEAFFKCFFKGLTADEVLNCHQKNESPDISFPHLKYVDILFCKQTERLVLMLAYFYPNVSLSAFDLALDLYQVTKLFLEYKVKMPFLRVFCRTEDIINEKLHSYVSQASCLKELRLIIDDQFPGADTDLIFNRQLETASVNLKNIFNNDTTIDSLAIKPHEAVDMAKVLLPSFGSHGSILRCLYIMYELSPVNINTLYQLLNLCPLLEKLILDLSLSTKDTSSKAFSTCLREHPSLETLVLQELDEQTEEQDEVEDSETPSAFSIIVRDILQCCLNLKNLSIPISEMCNTSFIKSQSVERLQLKLTDQYCSQLIFSVLPSFPSLKLLSVQGDPEDIWSESLESLSQKGVNVTRKVQEFTNVFKWHENINSEHSIHIMVM